MSFIKSKKRLINFSTAAVFFIIFFFAANEFTEAAHAAEPVTNKGKKWRIAYVEGGPYSNYQMLLKALTESLMESGWIEKLFLPDSENESENHTMWAFLADKVESDFLEFPADAYYSANWNQELRSRNKEGLIKRLKTRNDIDLILAFGTWAGQDLANNRHNTPTMVISCSDAVYSGIIKSVEDSGFDHIHAWIDPERSERQIRLFHDIVGFKKLGIAFENDLEGRSYAAVDDVLALSRELDFEVIEYHLPLNLGSVLKEEKALIKAYDFLAPKADAVYMTDYTGLTTNNIGELLSPLFEYKVPMFAQTRYDLAEYGVMISADRSSYKSDAKFYRETFANILNGDRPRDLPQKFDSPIDIVVNLESAKKVGFRIPIDVLSGAFKIHEKIKTGK